MTSRDFCYWLQGYFEIHDNAENIGLNARQASVIKAHLSMAFKHEIDPSMGSPEHQAELQKIHDNDGDNKKIEELEKQMKEFMTKKFDPHSTLIRC